ncbi:MAG: RrF2 family transcriptional regulator [Alkalispirochaetaceae bacterium]
MSERDSGAERYLRVASSKVRYATRALVYLAAYGSGRNVSVREIASAESIPEKYLEVIVGELRAAGVLESVKGKYGGFRLARKPSRIRLTDLFEILEASSMNGPEETPGDPTPAVWSEINRRVTEIIGEYTIADALLAEERRRGVVNYTI